MTTTSARSARYATGGIYYDEARGLWVGTVEGPKRADGRRNRPKVYHRDKQTMIDKRDALRDRIRRGEASPAKGWTVRSWCEHWLAHIAPKASRQGYAKTCKNWIYPHVGSRPLAKLQPEHVDRMLTALEHQGLADGTRALARRTLSAALTAALRRPSMGLHYNAAKLTAAPPSPIRHDPLTVEEVERVLAQTADDRLHALAMLALTAGLRRDECLALRWDDVNLRRRTLTVTAAKTESGVRTIPLTAQLVDALKAHQQVQRRERMAAPFWADAGVVFATPAGTRLTGNQALHWWQAQTRAAGLGNRRFHAARHTCGQVMLDHGASLEVVSAILGHSSVAVTAKIYARPNMDALRTGADAIGRAYGA